MTKSIVAASLACITFNICIAAEPNQDIISFINQFREQSLDKSEFETTETYKKRIDPFNNRQFTITIPVTSPNFGDKVFSYDADNEKLTVRFIGASTINTSQIVNYSNTSPIKHLNLQKFLIKEIMQPSKEYLAQTAMGVKFKVTEIRSEEWSIAAINIPPSGVKPAEQTINIDAQRAKKIFQTSYWRISFASTLIPNQSKFIISDSFIHQARLDSPDDIFVRKNTIMALIKTIELLEPDTGKVLASIATAANFPNQPQKGAKVLFGINCIPINDQLQTMAKAKDKSGCLIGAVNPDSVAFRSGLKSGDILLVFNEKQVSNEFDISEFIKFIEPGQNIKFKIWRNSQLFEGQAQF